MKMTWDWIAGFFEGEGNISWSNGKSATSNAGRGGRVVMGQKDKRPLEEIYRFLKGQGFVNPILYLRPVGNGTRQVNPIWVLALSRMEDTERFLRAISGMIPQKQEQADRVLLLMQQATQNTRIVPTAEAESLRKQGLTIAEIAKQLHFGTKKVTNSMRRAGTPTWPRPRDLDSGTIVGLRARGFSTKEIAAQTGYNLGSVKNHISRLKRTGVLVV